MFRLLLSAALVATAAWPAHAAGLTERQACLKLIGTARALHLAGPNKRGDYRCKRHPTDADFVFTLRFDGPKEPKDASHLLGHYAVDRATREVYQWDLTTGQRGAPLVPPKSKR
ncbi:hypothetical protein [Pelomonas sp. Root1237]|uniref:hypothetical protein n=1 Tax=Pelomonas sp. Root1237 TaxID=1736434 RepID=UPI000700863E|nr:hypothetical protein [Pelomonas sp. Root1237]KQV96050.1 hypothetical protein ASC91_00340 [Pelomonas sp. Root1237]